MGIRLPMGDKGPCIIIWDPLGDNIDLGESLGDTVLSVDQGRSPVEEERWGSAMVDACLTGKSMLLTVPFARNTLEQMAIFLHCDLVTSNDQLVFANRHIGCSLLALSRAIYLQPICDGVAGPQTEWIHLYHCFPVEAWALTFNRGDAQRIFNTEFLVFMSTESGKVGDFGTQGVV